MHLRTLAPLALLTLAFAVGCPGKPGDDSDGTDDSTPTDDSEETPLEECGNGADDDADGAADCADSDCANDAACQEDCTSGADEDVDGAIDCDDSDCTGDASCAPSLSGLNPDWGWTDRSGTVALTGAGFDWDTVGAVSVSFGGVDGTNVTVVDANTITVDSPTSATEQTVDVVLTTANGSATLSGAFRYVAPALYAATGTAGVAGNLYLVDAATGSSEALVALDYGFTGLAVDPNFVLYGVMSSRYGEFYPSQLCTIDPTNGAITTLGVLVDGDGVEHYSTPDITFLGDRLLGWSEATDQPVEINVTNGAVTILGGGTGSFGSGLVYDPGSGLLYAAPDGDSGDLYTIDPETGLAEAICTFSVGNDFPFHALAVLDGTLYAVTSAYGEPGTTSLVNIDPSTCAVTTLGALPDQLDSLASNRP